MVFSLSKLIESTESREKTQQAFETLMRNTYRQAYAMAIRLTSNPSEAEDLVQDSYVRAYRFFHRYDRALPFSSWLYRIMANAHVDSIRKKGRIKTSSLDQGLQEGQAAKDVVDPLETPDEAMLNSQMSIHVQRGLETLNPDFRMAVLLADVEGLAYEEVAEIMHTSVGTVRSRIHRGRKLMKSYLLSHAEKQYRSYTRELL